MCIRDRLNLAGGASYVESPLDKIGTGTSLSLDVYKRQPSGSSYIDAMQPGISKASGIAQVMEHHGIDASEVVAFGDAMNDYEIIRFVGTGCAMANGRPALRAVADLSLIHI